MQMHWEEKIKQNRWYCAETHKYSVHMMGDKLKEKAEPLALSLRGPTSWHPQRENEWISRLVIPPKIKEIYDFLLYFD